MIMPMSDDDAPRGLSIFPWEDGPEPALPAEATDDGRLGDTA
jgi:hypothetical protein